jgi:hypothetical protein
MGTGSQAALVPHPNRNGDRPADPATLDRAGDDATFPRSRGTFASTTTARRGVQSWHRLIVLLEVAISN